MISEEDILISRLKGVPIFCAGREYEKSRLKTLNDDYRDVYTFHVSYYRLFVYSDFDDSYDFYMRWNSDFLNKAGKLREEFHQYSISEERVCGLVNSFYGR